MRNGKLFMFCRRRCCQTSILNQVLLLLYSMSLKLVKRGRQLVFKQTEREKESKIFLKLHPFWKISAIKSNIFFSAEANSEKSRTNTDYEKEEKIHRQNNGTTTKKASQKKRSCTARLFSVSFFPPLLMLENTAVFQSRLELFSYFKNCFPFSSAADADAITCVAVPHVLEREKKLCFRHKLSNVYLKRKKREMGLYRNAHALRFLQVSISTHEILHEEKLFAKYTLIWAFFSLFGVFFLVTFPTNDGF